MENNSNFWWLHTPNSSSVEEIADLPYSTTIDNLRSYLDRIFFPFGYMPYYPINKGAKGKTYE